MLSTSTFEMLSTFDCDADWNSLDTYLNIDNISPIARASSSCPDLLYGDDLISQNLSATYWKESPYFVEVEEEVYPKSPVDITITDCDQAEDVYLPKFNLSKVTLEESFPYRDLYSNTPSTSKPNKCTKGLLHVPDMDKYGKLSGKASKMSCRKCRSHIKHPKIHVVASAIPTFFSAKPSRVSAHTADVAEVAEVYQSDCTLTTATTDTWETCSI